jgi:glycosyltransferase involved in cell wall biosynthesis
MLPRIKHLLRECYYTLNGWRFADLKATLLNEMESKIANLSAAGNHDFSRDQWSSQAPARVAVVGVLPPARTGIANFNAAVFAQVSSRVDLYTPVIDIADYQMFKLSLSQSSGENVAVFPLQLLLTGQQTNKYEAIVFALGNSDDHVSIVRELIRFSDYFDCRNVYVYLHDPCLHNVLLKAQRMSPSQYIDSMLGRYKSNLTNVGGMAAETPWRASEILVNRDIFGLRYLEELGVNHFVTNSAFASEIVKGDIGQAALPSELFHPVFKSTLQEGVHPTREGLQQWRDGNKELVVGSFGYPGPDKGTDVVVDAVRRARTWTNVRLRLIGYQAPTYVSRLVDKSDYEWIEAFEPRTQKAFETEIAKCDVAIQLRRRNLGESSGVVPNMIRHGIPVIASGTGAFAEYGAAVLYVSETSVDAVEEKLRQLKSERLEDSIDHSYADRHSVEAYLRRFFEITQSQ